MGRFRTPGVGGFASAAAILLVLLILVGGNTYRKDCLTERGNISTHWTSTWDSPIPFVFAPSEHDCVVHAGTRVALNVIGIDKFTESSAESIAGHSSSSGGGNPYWPKVTVAIRDLANKPRAASLPARIAALTRARDTLATLVPPPTYVVAQHRLLVAATALLESSQQLQQAFLLGDPHLKAAVLRVSDAQSSGLHSAVAGLNRVHSAQ
jgi:hypothetical protein